MARVLDSNSEGGFVFASMMEFMKAWEAGANSRLFLESFNGQAFVSFGCFLGQPSEKHVKPKKKEKSKKKQERDNMRAANFQAAMKSNDDVKTKEGDNDETVELPDEDFDTTRDEDYEDFSEEYVSCWLDVSTNKDNMINSKPTSKEDFVNEVLPELRTTVVQYVLDQESEGAFPSEDFRVEDVQWRHAVDHVTTSTYRVTFKYSQKLKKTKDSFANAFVRHLDRQKKRFTKDGIKFDFYQCILANY